MGSLRMLANFPGENIGLDLPVIVVDDDFFEYLKEEAIEAMDVAEFHEVWIDWRKRLLTSAPSSKNY